MFAGEIKYIMIPVVAVISELMINPGYTYTVIITGICSIGRDTDYLDIFTQVHLGDTSIHIFYFL